MSSPISTRCCNVGLVACTVSIDAAIWRRRHLPRGRTAVRVPIVEGSVYRQYAGHDTTGLVGDEGLQPAHQCIVSLATPQLTKTVRRDDEQRVHAGRERRGDGAVDFVP